MECVLYKTIADMEKYNFLKRARIEPKQFNPK